jgi:hypothetical protein
LTVIKGRIDGQYLDGLTVLKDFDTVSNNTAKREGLTVLREFITDFLFHWCSTVDGLTGIKQRRLGCRLFGNPTFPGIRWVAIEPQPNLRCFHSRAGLRVVGFVANARHADRFFERHPSLQDGLRFGDVFDCVEHGHVFFFQVPRSYSA